ncbi:MAG: DUF2179 domain-containing protein [Candidatus Omnitrophica bacterium]|nr:DUF2179 domain-containing protein [Candidatus Omnitrophota bacterium]
MLPTDSFFFQWFFLPLLIFLARVSDVSMDTMRILFISRGKRLIAPLLGFVQVLIWLLAIRQIFLNLSNPVCYIAYAAGFAMGTWVGILLEEKLAIGIQVLRVITRKDAAKLIGFLQSHGYGVTSVDGRGITGKVSIIYTIVKRQDIPNVINIIMGFNPKAFYTIEDVRAISEEVNFSRRNSLKRGLFMPAIKRRGHGRTS